MNQPSPPSPSGRPSSRSDSLDSFIIVIEGRGDTARRPRRRDIRGIPPGAFDLPPAHNKPKKKPADGLSDTP
jgi:hypothetical protein